VAANRQTAIESACAMLEQGAGLCGHAGLEIRIFLPGREGGAVEEWNDLVEKSDIFCELQILKNNVGQP